MTASEKVHSELGASSYSRWKECPGSVALSSGVEKKSSVYAEEGTLAHAWASHLLDPSNQPLPDGDLSDEMEEAIQVYIDAVSALRNYKPDFESVEQKLNLSSYHPKLFGTADYVCYFKNTKTLHVVDYKHGAGVAVEVEENEQLMYYGLGALHANKFPIEKVVLAIVQPRCYHIDGPVRIWSTDPLTMLDYAATLIEDAIKTEEKNAPLKTGDHCRWCPAQPLCPEIHKKALTAAKNIFGQTASYDPVKLAQTLKALDQIEAWAKSVRAFAYTEAEAGRIPPGFKLVDKRAMRKWKENMDPNELAGVFNRIPLSQFVETKLKSPAQVEKLLSKDQKPLLETLTVKESSGKNLVEDTDDRPQVLSKAKSVFETIETTKH